MKARNSAIQAVTFDVGGTLLTPHPSVGAIYAQTAAAHGCPELLPEVVETRFRMAWSQLQPFPHARGDWEHLVDEVFSGLTSRPPSTTFFPELYAAFGRAAAWRVFDDVLPTLEALAGQGLDLGIISNWDERLRPLLQELRLDRYFDCLVVSCETGFTKPSPVIYEEALRQLGCPASSVLHVGDDLGNDFAGATGAGFSALHLRRDAPAQDLQVQNLQDVLDWVSPRPARLGRRSPQNFLSPDG